jgi:hypothetical protein
LLLFGAKRAGAPGVQLVFTLHATVALSTRRGEEAMPGELLIKCRQLLKALSRRQLVQDGDLIPHRFQQFPLKKILNWMLVGASVKAKPE